MADVEKSKDQELREGEATPATEDLKATNETIDPRLDNRVGNQRPPLEDFPAKPQQVQGPDATQQVPNPRDLDLDAMAEKTSGPRKGMSSPGPHGLGDTEAVPFEDSLVIKENVNVDKKTSTTKNEKDAK